MSLSDLPKSTVVATLQAIQAILGDGPETSGATSTLLRIKKDTLITEINEWSEQLADAGYEIDEDTGEVVEIDDEAYC